MPDDNKVSKSGHILAAAKVNPSDLKAITGSPQLNTASEIHGPNDTILPPMIHNQILSIYNMSIAADIPRI